VVPHRLAQARLLCGDVRGQRGQLPQLRKEVHPALPGRRVALRMRASHVSRVLVLDWGIMAPQCDAASPILRWGFLQEKIALAARTVTA
jgi:hypothetical protein